MSKSKNEEYGKTLAFIEIVKKYPIFYDPGHKHFKQAYYINAAWVEVANETNDSVGNCKSKWNHMKMLYTARIKKGKHYMYKDAMNFLKPFVTRSAMNQRFPTMTRREKKSISNELKTSLQPMTMKYEELTQKRKMCVKLKVHGFIKSLSHA